MTHKNLLQQKLVRFYVRRKVKQNVIILEIDQLALGDHAAMAIDFKGEGFFLLEKILFFSLMNITFLALTFKATTDGVIHNLGFCIELMQKREDIWRIKYEKVCSIKCKNFSLSSISFSVGIRTSKEISRII